MSKPGTPRRRLSVASGTSASSGWTLGARSMILTGGFTWCVVMCCAPPSDSLLDGTAPCCRPP
eukprot:6177828-Alexandrium_andersonii.AAC.1